MPTNIKQLMTINPPTSPTEWLMVATRLMKTQTPKPEQNTFRQNLLIRPRQSTFVPQNHHSFRPNFQNFNRTRPQHLPNQHAHNFNNRGFRPNPHTHFQHGMPPYPCSFCTKQGIPNAYHWKQQCPFNQHQLRQTLFTCDSSLATNTVSQSSENSVSSQQIPNQRQHPSTETSGPEFWQLQVSRHISSLPSLANLDNLPKQKNVNIVIDTGSTLSLIFADIINFLGYEIKEGCITPDNQNIETILKLQPPKNVKQLQSFLGSINVYNKFMNSYAKIREPLNLLLKKDKQWDWTAECQTAFELLKNKLVTKPVLQLHDPKLPLRVFCDASLNAIGAVLKQSENSGTLHPVSYHSRTLRDYEKNYCITELEYLAIVDALHKFYYYLHGRNS
ncbi:transposon Tf2-6 polyprotein [Trichonephila clavipes]|uniref:Transposon Tf2-6 polyprotein n=1 Tax=Trichonephila clavipes TaxID=2585209 RepID=A0A8X6R7B7_TRICX|nr:transposon Tf2-6 polyprotein [Trichonephila clavipes]